MIYLFYYSFFPRICDAIRPFLPPLSVLVAAICAGAPLALNVECIKSPLGISILLLVVAFHLSAFIAGYVLSGSVFRDSPDVKPLQRTISFETGTHFLHFHPSNACISICYLSELFSQTAGMQSSLLALALANKFFADPVVGMPPAISVNSHF
jgi:BASS family bile acid:Na+ symporter